MTIRNEFYYLLKPKSWRIFVNRKTNGYASMINASIRAKIIYSFIFYLHTKHAYGRIQYIHSTVAKYESQQAWGWSNESLIKTKTSSIMEDVLVKIPLRYNTASGTMSVCRRRESNPHSRREHDFESCASAYSATSARVRPKVYHS